MSDSIFTVNDSMFLARAKEQGWIIDPVEGKIFAANGKERGSRSKESYNMTVCKDGRVYSLGRSRAIWIYVNGAVPAGYFVAHKSENFFDDRLDNLELSTNSIRNKKLAQSEHWSLNIPKHLPLVSNLTLEQVNEARREARKDPMINYQNLAEKYGVLRAVVTRAIKGFTWKNADEPPVPVRKGRWFPEDIKERNRQGRVERAKIRRREKATMLKALKPKPEPKPVRIKAVKAEKQKPEPKPKAEKVVKSKPIKVVPKMNPATIQTFGCFDIARDTTTSLLKGNMKLSPDAVIKILMERNVPNAENFGARRVMEIKSDLREAMAA